MPSDLYNGLMSGTSLDGVDAVLVDFSGSKCLVTHHQSAPLAPELRAQLWALNTPGPDELHRSALAAKDAIAGFEKGAPEDGEHQWQALLRGIPEKLPVSRRQWPLVKTYARQLST